MGRARRSGCSPSRSRGFHIASISTHLPPYLTDLGLSTSLAAWSLGLIGLFNVIGAYSAGVLGGTYPKRLLLSGIYLGRGIAFALFLLLPATPLTVLVFAPRSACSGSRPCRSPRASWR